MLTKRNRKTSARKKSHIIRIIPLILLSIMLFTACSGSTEEITLFKRKIGRVDLIRRQMDLYDMDTTISQLITAEQRTSAYNFSEGTKIAYQTTFLTVPATLIYAFGEAGALESIAFDFAFSADNAEQEVMDVYEECIKFFGYPDEGYTKAIYDYLDESPQILWIKNNAQITLDYWMSEDLVPRAMMHYRRSEWSGASVAVFKLPFTPHALGDSITTVVSAETKKNSATTDSVVRYAYKALGENRMTVDYVFSGETLEAIEMTLIADASNRQQMKNLSANMVTFMMDEFDGAYIDDRSDDKAYDIRFSGEATGISLNSSKDSGNREIKAVVVFYPYVS